MARSAIAAARKDARFQLALNTITGDVPACPEWPLSGVTPEEWESLPYRIKHRMSVIVSEYVQTVKGAQHG